MAHRPGAERGPRTGDCAKAYRLLRTILNSAVEDGLLARNPCIIWGAGVERSPERPVATIEQLYELANAMGPRYRLMVLLATFCGLRLGELLALRRARVDPLHRQIKVNEQRQELADGSRFLWAAQERSRHSIDRLATAPARGG